MLATKFRFSDGRRAERHRRVALSASQGLSTTSLQRLGTDRIDLYQIHMQDIATPEEETLRALDDLVRAGKVLYIGCSNYAAYRLVESLWTRDKRNLSRYVTLQAQYSLLGAISSASTAALPRHGLGILPWSPLAGGLLSGKYRTNKSPRRAAAMHKWRDRYKGFDNDRNWKIVDALRRSRSEIERPVSQIALAWLLARPAVTSVIFGARSVAQLEENLGAGDLTLSEKAIDRSRRSERVRARLPLRFIKNIDGKW